MNNLKNWVWLLLFGTLWGIFEVFGGEILFRHDKVYASVWLTVWAFFLLAMARGVLNRPGTSTIIGVFAAGFRLVNASPFFCHLLAIVMLGMTFDVFATVLLRHKRGVIYRSILSGLLSVYAGRAIFGILATYIIRYERWTAGESETVFDHVFVYGSIAALMTVAAVPLGYWLGVNGMELEKRYPRLAFAGSLVLLFGLWTLGRMT